MSMAKGGHRSRNALFDNRREGLEIGYRPEMNAVVLCSLDHSSKELLGIPARVYEVLLITLIT